MLGKISFFFLMFFMTFIILRLVAEHFDDGGGIETFCTGVLVVMSLIFAYVFVKYGIAVGKL